mmetsp:Transcript_9363/g.22580  ORF Transcript_9363/g.22580 Transcript_9363/m.22580 type:complete len:246 (-) Transcript_9363:275-1012(-)
MQLLWMRLRTHPRSTFPTRPTHPTLQPAQARAARRRLRHPHSQTNSQTHSQRPEQARARTRLRTLRQTRVRISKRTGLSALHPQTLRPPLQTLRFPLKQPTLTRSLPNLPPLPPALLPPLPPPLLPARWRRRRRRGRQQRRRGRRRSQSRVPVRLHACALALRRAKQRCHPSSNRRQEQYPSTEPPQRQVRSCRNCRGCNCRACCLLHLPGSHPVWCAADAARRRVQAARAAPRACAPRVSPHIA